MSVRQYKLPYLRREISDTDFLNAYTKLLRGTALSDSEIKFLLSLAIVFLSYEDKNVRRLGYAILLKYGNHTGDYQPLYDVALAHNYIPIARLISSQQDTVREENLSSLALHAYQEVFKDGDIYRSSGQLALSLFARNNTNIAVVAPTSYGKSELMIEKVKSNVSGRVCILVPTKALVSQTKRKLLKSGLGHETHIITHPDMYTPTQDNDSPFVAIFTQERLLRLFTKYPFIKLDALFIDEAHNILGNDTRSLAIAQATIIAKKRNPHIDISFFSPFISDESNIAVLGTSAPLSQKIDEHMKIERFYYTKLEAHAVYQYDQFIDKSIFIHNDPSPTAAEFVLRNAIDKNVTYLNRPRDVELFARQLARSSPELENTNDPIIRAINSIREFTHPEYGLISCIEKGIVYHHGGMPEIIKMYVESLYSEEGMKHLVTTSTLMEGVNIPANKLFILNTGIGNGVLSKSQFINLIGRVGRFSEVFSSETGSLQLLEPSIYIVDDYNFARKDLNAATFYSNRVKLGTITKDEVENPLLKKSEDEGARADELGYLANIEPALPIVEEANIHYATTTVGKLCFAHSIRDFDIIQHENLIEYRLRVLTGDDADYRVNNPEQLLNIIINVFLKDTVYDNNETVKKLVDYGSFSQYYAMFMNWFMHYTGYGYMISRVLRYWSDKQIVYVGRMGEVDKDGNPNARYKKYAIIEGKTLGMLVDLSISLIKENQDFIDNNITPYIDILDDLGLVDQDFYNTLKYHTDDERIVTLIKYGLTYELSKLLTSTGYLSLISISGDEFTYDKNAILTKMRARNENEILIFEAVNYL